MARVRLQIDKKQVCSIGMAAYLGKRDGNPNTVYGRLGDLSPAWDGVAEVIFASNEETFAKEGAKQGFASWWDDYVVGPNIEYIQWKLDQVGHVRLMDLTGWLKLQLTGKTGTHYEERGKWWLAIGSDYPAHPGTGLPGQFGINAPDPSSEDVGGIVANQDMHPFITPHTKRQAEAPAHSVFRMTDGDVDEICEQILDHITHARRLHSRFRVRPSASRNRIGHYVVGPRVWKGRLG